MEPPNTESSEAQARSVPITVLSGFLGAGKTTLLNHAVLHPLFSRALVVINELGAISIDHDLVENVNESVVALPSGCVCCAVRGDLVSTLLEQRGRREFDRVLLETTGLADPTPLLATIHHHRELSERFHLDALITAFDAVLGEGTIRTHAEARRQLELADDVVLTKLDEATRAQALRAADVIREHNAFARVFASNHGHLDWQALLAWNDATLSSRLDPSAAIARVDHSADVHAIAIRTDTPASWTELSLWLSMLTQLHGDALLRCKGLIAVEGELGPVSVQSAQHVVYPPFALREWPSEDTSTRLVLITRGLSESARNAIEDEARAALRAPPRKKAHRFVRK